ncbi:MAG: TonB-dependent receptor [Holophagales bacterium]|nr:TonB-dependent receptor [Holophagales bacterium]
MTAASAALVKGKATTVTDSRGGYRFPSLPPGTYLVEAALQGFRKVQQPDVRVGLGQALVIDLTLRLESVKTEVTVTGEAPLVSVVSNEVSNNFGQEFLEKAPLPRNYYAIIKTAPGVNLYGNGSGSSILAYGGTDARQNSYTIDGVNVADSGGGGYWMLPSIQWMDEIQVSGLGANAEYGAYTGGVINGVTKSGGNEVHGGLEVYYQPEAWTADNAPADYDAEAKFKFTDVAASIGGPLAKDKLWFFASAEYWQQITTPVGALDSTDRKIPRFLGKLTWQPGEATRVSMMGEYDKVTQERRGVSLYTLPEASYKQDGPNATFALNAEHLINSSNFLNLKVTGYDGRDDALPYNGFDTPGRIDEDSGYAWVQSGHLQPHPPSQRDGRRLLEPLQGRPLRQERLSLLQDRRLLRGRQRLRRMASQRRVHLLRLFRGLRGRARGVLPEPLLRPLLHRAGLGRVQPAGPAERNRPLRPGLHAPQPRHRQRGREVYELQGRIQGGVRQRRRLQRRLLRSARRPRLGRLRKRPLGRQGPLGPLPRRHVHVPLRPGGLRERGRPRPGLLLELRRRGVHRL